MKLYVVISSVEEKEECQISAPHSILCYQYQFFFKQDNTWPTPSYNFFSFWVTLMHCKIISFKNAHEVTDLHLIIIGIYGEHVPKVILSRRIKKAIKIKRKGEYLGSLVATTGRKKHRSDSTAGPFWNGASKEFTCFSLLKELTLFCLHFPSHVTQPMIWSWWRKKNACMICDSST